MRLLQLNTNGSDASAIEFHPMVTVVRGLSEPGREAVIRAVTALPQGHDPGCRGLVEAHGILLDLDTDTLALLDLAGDLDVLVRPADIPGVGATAPVALPTPSVLPASVEPLSVERFLEITPEGVHPELDAAREAQRQAQEAREVLHEAVERARSSHAEITASRVALERQLDEARRVVQKANLRLVTDEYEPEAVDDDEEPEDRSRSLAEIDADRAALAARVEELEAEVARVDRGIDELAGVDPRPIQVLLDAIRNPPPAEMVPSARANELADEFVALQSQVQVLEDSLDERGFGSRAAMARLDAARLAVADAEKAMRKPEVTEQDRIELEAAHDAVLEFGSKGRRGGKKRLEEAMAKEQEILDRMGFPTWSAYVMGSGLMAIDPAAEHNLELARAELDAAEEHWSNVAALIEADPVHRELLDKIETVYLEAFDLLGGDDEQDDLEARLRALQEPKQEVTTDELVDALAYQLELVGMKLPPEAITVDRTVLIADAFLEEASAITDRLNELGAEKVAALTELEEIEQRQADLDAEAAARGDDGLDGADELLGDDDEPAVGGDEPAPGHTIDLDELTADAADLSGDPELDDVARLEVQLEATAAEEEEYREFVEAREALLDVAIQVETVATAKAVKIATELTEAHNADAAERGDAGPGAADEPEAEVLDLDGINSSGVADEPGDATPEAIEFYLLARLAALRSVSYAGSVPLVIDDALAGLDRDDVEQLLHKLERMSESVQIVYLSDDPTVRDWALGIGYERGAVVEAPASFGADG